MSGPPPPHALYAAGIARAARAVEEDRSGNLAFAKALYIEAGELLLRDTKRDSDANRVQTVRRKIAEYIGRGEELQETLASTTPSSLGSSSAGGWRVARGASMLGSADGQGPSDSDDAGDADNDEDLISPSTPTGATRGGSSTFAPATATSTTTTTTTTTTAASTASKSHGSLATLTSRISASAPNPSPSSLTPAEILVLKNTSYINNRCFAPWLDIDLQEKFYFTAPFDDPDGKLALAEKQRAQFGGWKRVSELSPNPVLIDTISPFSIRQTVVSDCSFVASLSICSLYEKKFHKKIITRCIYPQHSSSGQPIYNPDGKYCVRLLINGVARKVIVDDFLPVGKDGKLLCSFSTNPNEFWVSIIEKAYMKVMGGYDFPGSNSNIDMYALTGWIPERCNMRSADFKSDALFARMKNGLQTGDVLMTMSTGPMPQVEEDRTGLVQSHAYAILDVREVQGLKFLLIKNPWSHRRWKGVFSELDEVNWTPQLMSALGYDRRAAQREDNGVFWMNWESVCKFFDVVYLNWNPQLLKYRHTLHSCWPTAAGPRKDAYNLGYNPQYRLEVNSQEQDAVVCVLLSKHIVDKADFADNKDYITIHVYEGVGGRVYYPDNPHIEGTKINSPHVFTKLKVSKKGRSLYTLVVSQYEKNSTINYTIKVFSSAPVSLSPVPEIYKYNQKLVGEWGEETAGGCGNHSTFFQNPQFKLTVGDGSSSSSSSSSSGQTTMVKIEAPREYAAGVAVFKCGLNADGSERVDSAYSKALVSAAPQFRHGFCYTEIERLPPGDYVVVPSTFEPNCRGNFFLGVASEGPFTLTPLPGVGAGMSHHRVTGEWVKGTTGAGCENHKKYDMNPMHRVSFGGNRPCQLFARLRLLGQPRSTSDYSLNVALFPSGGFAASGARPRTLSTAKAHSGDYTNARCGVVLPRVTLDPGEYLLVPSTFEPVSCEYVLDVYVSLSTVSIGRA